MPNETPRQPAQMLADFVGNLGSGSARIVDRIGGGPQRNRTVQADPGASEESARVTAIYGQRRQAARTAATGNVVGNAGRSATNALRVSTSTGNGTGQASGLNMGGLGQASIQGGMYGNPNYDYSHGDWGRVSEVYNRSAEERAYGGRGNPNKSVSDRPDTGGTPRRPDTGSVDTGYPALNPGAFNPPALPLGDMPLVSLPAPKPAIPLGSTSPSPAIPMGPAPTEGPGVPPRLTPTGPTSPVQAPPVRGQRPRSGANPRALGSTRNDLADALNGVNSPIRNRNRGNI